MSEKYVDQLSIFLENKEGRLLKTLDIIEKLNINIRALSVADTSDFGILRLIVSDPLKVKEQLEERDFTVKITKVIAVAIADEPGGLNKVLRILDEKNINIEYLYAFVKPKSTNAILMLKLEDDEEDYYKILEEGNVEILSPEEIYSI